jgi:hypothetical protein
MTITFFVIVNIIWTLYISLTVNFHLVLAAVVLVVVVQQSISSYFYYWYRYINICTNILLLKGVFL